MNNILLYSDYYPVYKDISDLRQTRSGETEIASGPKEYYNTKGSQSPGIISPESQTMFDSGELIRISSGYGFPITVTSILLLKNAFEGHTFMNTGLRPDQICNTELPEVKERIQQLITDFYEQVDLYLPGIEHALELIRLSDESVPEFPAEPLVMTMISLQLIRFPVAACSSWDPADLTKLSNESRINFHNKIKITLIAEKSLAGYLQIKNINTLYATKFNDLLEQIRIKEEILAYFSRKMVLANDPAIMDEESLEASLYKYLVDAKTHSQSAGRFNFYNNPVKNNTSDDMETKRSRIKHLYRLISKNCREVHTVNDGGKQYPELNNAFLEANEIYNDHVSDLAEAILHEMNLILLLSKVFIYRKSNGLTTTEVLRIESIMNNELLSFTDEETGKISSQLETKITLARMKNATDFKAKYVTDDELSDYHRTYLVRQIEFIDLEIKKTDSKIKEILIRKSHK